MPVEGRDLSSRQTKYVVKDLEIGRPINSAKGSETADGVARESKGVRSCPRAGCGRSACPVRRAGCGKRSHGRTTKAPPDERGGNRYVRPTETAPHLDSAKGGHAEHVAAATGSPQKASLLAAGRDFALGPQPDSRTAARDRIDDFRRGHNR